MVPVLAFLGLQDDRDTRQDDPNDFRLTVAAGLAKDSFKMRSDRIEAVSQIFGDIFHF